MNPAAGTSTAVSIYTTTGTGSAPLQAAVDAIGDIYLTRSGVATVSDVMVNASGLYAYSAASFAGIATPQAVVADPSTNLYIADKTTGTVYEIVAGTVTNPPGAPAVIAAGFTNPVGLALNGLGNLYVADQGAPGVYKIANLNGTPTTTLYAGSAGASPTVVVPGLVSVAIAADAGGNVYVQDSSSKSVFNIPVSQTGPAYTTVLTGLMTPNGLAVDGNGVLYSVDSGARTITQVKRNAASFAFGSNTALTFAGIIGNAGNLNATGYQATGYQATGLDSTDFPVTSVSPTNCFAANPITPGYACSVTAQFSPGSGTGNVSGTLAYTPATASIGTLLLTGVKTGAAVTTTTTIGTSTPSAPIYVASGTEVTFPVSVAASTGSVPPGSITVTVDALTLVSYVLNNAGQYAVQVAGLKAGPHTITAAYANQGGLTGSTSMTTNFTIAQATVAVGWTPTVTIQQFSAAIGAGVLDATATVGGTTVPGYFIYTATPTSGAATPIHSASYLPIGTNALAATFVPNDQTDFSGGTGAVPSYTVTQASTSAALGASQMVVASDGTGNFTSVQATTAPA